MMYCAICGREHDPDLSCIGSASQALKAAGMDNRRQTSDSDFKRIARLADRWFIKLLIALMALLVVMMILSAVLKK